MPETEFSKPLGMRNNTEETNKQASLNGMNKISLEEGKTRKSIPYVFQMPLHYPRYGKADYQVMPEWQVDRLLKEYGLPVVGDLGQKRQYAIGSFIWPQESH